MPTAPRTFLDTSVLFTAIWSDRGGGRMVLQLGEAGAVQIVVSRQVLTELERALRRKAPHALGGLALLLDRARVEVAPEPFSETLTHCEEVVSHPGDARILAGAIASQVDYLITLDRQHFLENAAVRRNMPFTLGTPGDFSAWFRDWLARE